MSRVAEACMRAAYLSGKVLKAEDVVLIEDETFHHWTTVLRMKSGEEILLFNGLGVRARAKINEIKKRSLQLKVMEVVQVPATTRPDVLLLTPKRDALESMLKAAAELACDKILLLRGEYSQEKLPDGRRVEALLQSALEQSNNPWAPQLVSLEKWEEFDASVYEQILVMDVGMSTAANAVRNSGQKILLVVGPEAGFSAVERERFKSWNNASVITLPSAILRAPTAMIAGLGWWYGRA
jgi:16S rRNA (uracil1498-N3)-methyltransferase